MATFYKASSENYVSTTLNGSINDSATTVTVNDASKLQAPGVIVIDREDGNGTATPTLREIVSFTAIAGNDLTGCTRAAESSTASAHGDGALVEAVFTQQMWNDLRDAVAASLTTAGTGIALSAVASIATLRLTTAINASGASVVGITPSGASGAVLTSWGNSSAPVFATPASAGAGVDGWVDQTADSWAYASASTITVPSGAASLYQKGDRLRFKQGAGYKYYVVVSVADTVLTVAVNNDYTVANAAITDNYYSHELCPIGYPTWFGYDPTWVGFSSDPTADQQYRIDGNMCTIRMIATGTSNSATLTFTMPVTATTIGGATESFLVSAYDNSGWKAQPGIVGIVHTSAIARVGIDPSTQSGGTFAGFTTSNNKGLSGSIFCRF